MAFSDKFFPNCGCNPSNTNTNLSACGYPRSNLNIEFFGYDPTVAVVFGQSQPTIGIFGAALTHHGGGSDGAPDVWSSDILQLPHALNPYETGGLILPLHFQFVLRCERGLFVDYGIQVDDNTIIQGFTNCATTTVAASILTTDPFTLFCGAIGGNSLATSNNGAPGQTFFAHGVIQVA